MNQPAIIIDTPAQPQRPDARLYRFEREVNELTRTYMSDVSLLHFLHMPDFVIENAGNAFDRVMEEIARKYPDVISRLES